MTRDEHVLGFKSCDIWICWWIGLLSFFLKQIWTFGICWKFWNLLEHWNWLFSFELIHNLRFGFGTAYYYVTFGSVLGLQVNTGLQPPACWEPFVAGIMLRRPESSKEKVEATTLTIIAIKIRHLTRFALLWLLRIQRYMWRNHVATWAYASASQTGGILPPRGNMRFFGR